MSRNFAGKAQGGAAGQPASSRFDRPPHVVDEGGAATHQGLAAAKEGEIGLGHGGAMLYGGEQAGSRRPTRAR